jgi:hypothetical protein
MASTLALLAHDSVRAVVGLKDVKRQELALVFKNAFDDQGNEFPINFDKAWKWLGYTTKHGALHRLKRAFKEGLDFIRPHGAPSRRATQKSGPSPDEYLLTTTCFELFAMQVIGSRGTAIRRLFAAVKAEYFRSLAEIEARQSAEDDAIIGRKRALVEFHDGELLQPIKKPQRIEAEVRDRLARELDALTEVPCTYGVVDVVSSKEVVEVKRVHN